MLSHCCGLDAVMDVDGEGRPLAAKYGDPDVVETIVELVVTGRCGECRIIKGLRLGLGVERG